MAKAVSPKVRFFNGVDGRQIFESANDILLGELAEGAFVELYGEHYAVAAIDTSLDLVTGTRSVDVVLETR